MYSSDGGSTAGGIPTIPGDPGTLSAAAARLGAAASAVRDWGTQLGSITSGLSGSTWSGQGAVSFTTCISKLQGAHRTAASALADASSALTTYSAELAECQAIEKAARASVAQAESDASSALSRLNGQPLDPHDPGAAAARAYAVSNINSTMEQEIGLAVSKAQAAYDRYEAAALRAAAQIGNAIPSWSSISHEIGWLNDKAGFGLVPLGLGFLAPLGRAGLRWLNTAKAIDGARPGWSDDPSTFLTQEADPWLYAQREQMAADLFAQDGPRFFGEGGLDDLPFAGALTGFSRVLAGASVASDVAEIISPDDSGAVRALDRGMAAANGVVSADAMLGGIGTDALGGALGIADVSTSWIPVAGQVILAGSALYLAGDWAYNNVKWFHDGVDDVGSFVKNTALNFADGTVHDVSAIGHGLDDVAHFFGL